MEFPSGLLVSPAHVGRLRREESRLEPLSVLHGRTSQAFGEHVVATLAGGLGAGHQKVRASVSADELQLGAQQGVVLAPSARCFCQLLGQHPLAARAETGAHDIPVDRMRETDLQTTTVHTAGEKTPVLERREGGGIGQLVQCRLRQRPPEGGELQGVAFRVGQTAQTSRDQLDQAGGRLQWATQPPDVALLSQRAAVERADDQLVEKQRITERALGDLSEGHRVNRPAEHGQEQVFNGRSVERTELNPGGAIVLPEHDHGVGPRLGRARRRQHAGEHGGRAGEHQLMDQGR